MQNYHACFQACGYYSLKVMHDSKQKFSHTAKWFLFSYPVTNGKVFVPFHSICILRCPFVWVISHAYTTSLRSMKQYGTLLRVHHRSSTWAQQPQSTWIRLCTTADRQRWSVAVFAQSFTSLPSSFLVAEFSFSWRSIIELCELQSSRWNKTEPHH